MSNQVKIVDRVLNLELRDVDSLSMKITSPPTWTQLIHVSVIEQVQASSVVNPALIYMGSDGLPYAGFGLGDDIAQNDTVPLIQFCPGLPTTVMSNRHDTAVTIQMSALPVPPGGEVEVAMLGADAPASDLWDVIFIFKQIG